MTTATLAPHTGRHETMTVAAPFTGVGSLVRLALRRDRIRLSVWIAALTLMMANELMLTLIIATSILSILAVSRHTRAEEESGAAELVLSSVVGRYART